MNNITLCCTTNNPNIELLNKMLHSATVFNTINLHFNNSKIYYPHICHLGIRAFYPPNNLTAAEGFNFVISMADTEWIAPFCDDDFYDSKELSILLDWMNKNEIKEDIIQFPMLIGNERDNIWNIWGNKKATFEELKEHNMLSFGSFYRKKVWEKIGGYDNIPFNDWHFWLKALKLGFQIKYWDSPVYYFRQGVEERLSDKEYKAQPFEKTKKQILDLVEKFNV